MFQKVSKTRSGPDAFEREDNDDDDEDDVRVDVQIRRNSSQVQIDAGPGYEKKVHRLSQEKIINVCLEINWDDEGGRDAARRRSKEICVLVYSRAVYLSGFEVGASMTIVGCHNSI